MQVNRSNFDSIVGELKEILRTCEFYSVDQEMTGISVPDGVSESPLASLAEVYPSKRAAALRYNAFQIGICTFHRENESTPTYTVRPFNFWLCNRGQSNADVTLNMSAVSFLLNNRMDFQQWLRDGLPYANDSTASSVRRSRELVHTNALNVEDREWVDAAFEKIAAWHRTNESPTWEGTLGHVSHAADVALFHKLYAADVFVQAEPDLLSNTPPWKRQTTKIQRCESADNQRCLARARDSANRSAAHCLGFREVWETLIELKGKPQLGHNYSSDLMFLEAMHGAGLPASFDAFCDQVHDHFPRIYDTKSLAASIDIGVQLISTSLEPLFNALEQLADRPFTLKFPLGFESYSPSVVKAACGGNAAVAHQGAYDAYMTGVVFLHYSLRFPSQTRELENIISVFGSAYQTVLGRAGGDRARILPGKFFVLETPVLVGKAAVDVALRTDEERKMSESERRKFPPPFSIWACPESHRVFVLHLKPGHEFRRDRIPEDVNVTPLEQWSSLSLPSWKRTRAEAGSS